jgi:peptidoglycan/xylan/chitin deacetylase (PgdA/CDA1 family)
MIMLGLGIAGVAILGLVASMAYVYWSEARSPRLVCLMYHRFVTDEEYRACRGSERVYSLPISHFEDQLRFLRERGYRSVRMADAVAFARREQEIAGPAVLITIDDGCRSVLTRAAGLLRKYGMKAILFVTTDPRAYVFASGGDEQRRMSDDELRSLPKDVIEIGAHSMTHRPLTTLADSDLAQELRGSRELLERVLGRPVRYMAVPGGWYDDRVRRLAVAAGYDGVCASSVGAVRPGCDPHELPRVNVSGTYGLAAFERFLSPGGIAQRRFSKALKQIPQRLVGPKIWTPIGKALRAAIPSRGSAAALICIGAAIASFGVVMRLRLAA